MQRTDTELLAAFTRDADAEAFTRLVERHVDIVYAAARRQARGAGDALADDITQAVFLILLKRARTIRDGRLLAAWLLNVTNYCTRDALKAERRRKAREAQVAKSVAKENPADAHTRHELEMAGLLDEGLAALPPIDRQAVVQRYWNNQPLAKVGSTLGISEEAARKRLTRAIEKLRKFFAKRGIKIESTAVTSALTDNARANAPDNVKSACIALAFKSALIATSGATSAATIAKGALMAMKISKAAAVVAITAIFGAGGATGYIVYHAVTAPNQETPRAAVETPPAITPLPEATTLPNATTTTSLTIIDAPHAGETGEIYVINAVKQPGVYPITGRRVTVKQAVAMADGTGPDGNLDTTLVVALIRRDGATETTAWEGIGGVLAGLEPDRFVQPNDILNVNHRPEGFFDVMGLVARPGAFQLQAGRIVTIRELFSKWESAVDPEATLSIRIVRRIDTATETSETFTLDPNLTGPNADRVILANDLIIVEAPDAANNLDAAPASTAPATQSSKTIAILGTPATKGQFTIRGGVGNQGAYDLMNRPTTVLQALAETTMGQGAMWPSRVLINHADGTTATVNIKKVLAQQDPNIYVQPSDVLNVESTFSVLSSKEGGASYLVERKLKLKRALTIAHINGWSDTQDWWLYRREASGNVLEKKLDIKPDGTGADANLPIWVDDFLDLREARPLK